MLRFECDELARDNGELARDNGELARDNGELRREAEELRAQMVHCKLRLAQLEFEKDQAAMASRESHSLEVAVSSGTRSAKAVKGPPTSRGPSRRGKR